MQKVQVVNGTRTRFVVPEVAKIMVEKYGWAEVEPKPVVQEQSVAAAKQAIRDAETLEEVTGLLDAEVAGLNRASVVKLANQRIEELTNETPETEA